MKIGFSTGSLAKGDFREALRMINFNSIWGAIELSALRETELPELIDALETLPLENFKYISIHAPSKLINFSEAEVIDLLKQVTDRNIPVVVHPDIIVNFEQWRELGNLLCIENMDKRKPIGRTVSDLMKIFEKLPEASFCLDLAHAKQIDPSMVECANMLRYFSEKLIQFHISDVTSNSNHVPINVIAIEAFRKVAKLIPSNIPFIIESPVPEYCIEQEYHYIKSVFHINQHYINHHPHFIFDNF